MHQSNLEYQPTPEKNVINIQITGAHKEAANSNHDIIEELASEPYKHTEQERKLWRAVIGQAIIDAKSGAKKAELKNRKSEALVWLRGNTKDFEEVCHFAGYEPEYVRSKIEKNLDKI